MEGGATAAQLEQEVEELRDVLRVSQLQLEDLNSACRLLVQAIAAQFHYNQTKVVQLKKKRRKTSSQPGEETASGRKKSRKSLSEQSQDEKTPSKKGSAQQKASSAPPHPTGAAQSSASVADLPPPSELPMLKKQPSLADAIPDTTVQLQQLQATLR